MLAEKKQALLANLNKLPEVSNEQNFAEKDATISAL